MCPILSYQNIATLTPVYTSSNCVQTIVCHIFQLMPVTDLLYSVESVESKKKFIQKAFTSGMQLLLITFFFRQKHN